MVQKGYEIKKSSISQSSINKFFSSFIKICKFYAPKYFEGNTYKSFDSQKLSNDLISLRKENKIKFSSIYDAIWNASFLAEFYSSNKLTNIGAKFLNCNPDELCLRSPGFRIDVPNDTRNTYGWHQDSAYDKLNSVPSNGALVWCPLISTSFKNGTILVKPGSEIEENVCVNKKKGKELVTKQLLVPKKYLDKYKTLSVPVKKNDCLVMNANVFHKSGINTSKKVRFTFVIRFNKILSKDYFFFKKSLTVH
tara:strand:+ start:1785 stop:2537 length:753 start_codon:yes stop_codon:yes gene_type:complete